MLRTLLFFSIIILSSNAQAKSPIDKCFAGTKTNGRISVCLSVENVKIDNIRKTIAKELIDIIKTKPYVIPKHLKEKIEPNTYPEAELSFKSSSGKRVKASNGTGRSNGDPLKEALKRQAIRDDSLREQKIKSDILRHIGKKNELIEMHIKSTIIFEQYRELECNRLKQHFIDPNAPSLSEYKYKICLYDMTNQRIKSLQKSIEQ
ncbi:MAG: hypothetical protein COA45_01555 [Zetaproteobacteria bacterium]|nr:MAG: hypothetical protein COA45_01555 [Zetaproteobacteria bacterium]